MMKRERLELTFGEKDAELWEYLEQTGLPKASVVKKIIRDHVQGQRNAINSTFPYRIHEAVEQARNEHPEMSVAADVKKDKPTSLFGGIAVKK